MNILITEKELIDALRDTCFELWVNYHDDPALEERVSELLTQAGINPIKGAIHLMSPEETDTPETKQWRTVATAAFNAGVALGLLLAPKPELPAAPMNQDAAAKDVREELLAVLGASGKPHLTESARGWLKLLPKATAKHRLNDVWMGRILGRVAEELPDLVRSFSNRRMLWRIRAGQAQPGV
jgi:hypothetical protein